MEPTTSKDIAVEAVRRQAAADEYGPIFQVEDVRRGHPRHDGDSLCPECGRFQDRSPVVEEIRRLNDGSLPYSFIRTMCFEHAEWVVEFTYDGQHGWRAVYGVPSEGPPSCWMS